MTTHAPTAGPGAVVSALLQGAIDYAGLFPPAGRDMAGAVAEYTAHARSDDRWALGRFVIPAARLDELARFADARPETERRGRPGAAGGLSVVLGPDVAADADRVKRLTATRGDDDARWWRRVEAVELRASTAASVDQAVRTIPVGLECFVEIPITTDPRPLVRAIRSARACAKVRAGGTTADAFPSSADLARFLAACVAEDVRFKATAGLHHPLRGEYRLTYEPDSPAATMYGFLNVFLATAFLQAGMSEAKVGEVLEERDPTAIQFDDQGVSWREDRLSVADLARARELGVRSFGSCSFREPIDDLTAAGLL